MTSPTAKCLLIAAAALLLGAAPPSLADQQARLRAANAAARTADARAKSLEIAATAERNSAARAAQQEAAVAARIDSAAAAIGAATARTAIVDRLLGEQRTRLAERQAPILNLVAAIQSLARRPASLALAQPGSTADIVHVRAVLGSLMPLVRQRSAAVRQEIVRTRALRANAALAQQSLHDGRTRLQSERLALVRLEGEHRSRSRDLARGALYQSDRAIALGEEARDLVDQMATTATDAETAAALAALPGPLPRPGEAAAGDVAATSFSLPPYRLPAAGRVVAGLGELSDAGVRSRGVTIEVAPNAPVTAPAAGRILFARAFRDYGIVVIIDHGGGWSSAITGLGAALVKPGDAVTQGAPLGRAAAVPAPRVAVELRRRGTPVDLAQLIG